jgi:hypothetical protein
VHNTSLEKGFGTRRERDQTRLITEVLRKRKEKERDICYTLKNLVHVHLPFQHTSFRRKEGRKEGRNKQTHTKKQHPHLFPPFFKPVLPTAAEYVTHVIIVGLCLWRRHTFEGSIRGVVAVQAPTLRHRFIVGHDGLHAEGGCDVRRV